MSIIRGDNKLCHYGVKGMKWGVHKMEERGGDLYLKKGTIVKRVSTDNKDRTTNNRKYVSINQDDHSKWDDYLGRLYLNRGRLTTTHTYKTTKDIKVMSSEKQGELYTKMLLDNRFKNKSINDLDTYYKYMPQVKRSNDPSTEISRILSADSWANLETGKKFVDEVMKRGYDALEDTHGKNTAESPVIILNANTNIKHIKKEYTEASKNYIKKVYGVA